MRLRLHIAPMVALTVLSACNPFPHLPHRNLSPGTTVMTISDFSLVSDQQDFETFAEQWPSICSPAENARICLMDWEGKHTDYPGWHHNREALVLLPGNIICRFAARQFAERGNYVITRSVSRDGRILTPSRQLPASLQQPSPPDRASFARLCRFLT